MKVFSLLQNRRILWSSGEGHFNDDCLLSGFCCRLENKTIEEAVWVCSTNQQLITTHDCCRVARSAVPTPRDSLVCLSSVSSHSWRPHIWDGKISFKIYYYYIIKFLVPDCQHRFGVWFGCPWNAKKALCVALCHDIPSVMWQAAMPNPSNVAGHHAQVVTSWQSATLFLLFIIYYIRVALRHMDSGLHSGLPHVCYFVVAALYAHLRLLWRPTIRTLVCCSGPPCQLVGLIHPNQTLVFLGVALLIYA